MKILFNHYDLDRKVDRILIGCRMLADDNFSLGKRVLNLEKELRKLKAKLDYRSKGQ